MRLSGLSWWVFGCALCIFGTSAGEKPFPSSQEIEKLEHEIEEVFSQRKELDNDPIAKGESVNGLDALNEKHPDNGDWELRARVTTTWNCGSKSFPEYGIILNDFKGCSSRKSEVPQAQECPNVTSITCDRKAIYRTFDGSCNNLKRPHLGQAGSCHRRILAAEYDDNREGPKICDKLLPNPRNVCLSIHRYSSRYDQSSKLGISALFMAFGQFIDHDLTLTTTVTLPNNAQIPCCPIGTTNHRECFPILLQNDPDFRGNCMNFSRSSTCKQCVVEQRQQLNVLTPFLDCSHIYGLTADEANLLRGGRPDGKLNTTRIGQLELLPQNVNATPQCGSTCFRTGDVRSNQNLLLTMLHTVFVLFHNAVVDEMKIYNPRWDAEKLYQESKKFVCCCFQRIIYDVYLPILVGEDAMSRYLLRKEPTKYNDLCDPRTINEAMTAAFRLHSTVPDYFFCENEDGEDEIIPLGNNFFNVTPFYMGKLPCIAKGSWTHPQMEFDPILVESVMKFLYVRSNATPPALDLCSINIQRGRDNGLPGYTAYLYLLFEIEIFSFHDLRGFLYPHCIMEYKELYRSVHQIDLWSALQCEITEGVALLGKVGREILAMQFQGTKYGDRFFWTHRSEKGSLTKSEREAVRAMTLERIMCEALKLKNITKFVFLYDLPEISCNEYDYIPRMDLSKWGK